MNILEKIVTQKKKRLAQLQEDLPFVQLVSRWENSPPKSKPLPTLKTLFTAQNPGTFHVIAEIKRASPSKGLIPWALPLEEILHQYKNGGASMISVLTEENFFQGSCTIFQTVRSLSPLPLLRKDFIFTEYQVYESALLGASAILLITSLLDEMKLCSLLELVQALGLHALVECRDEVDLAKAVSAGATLIGINNRDLRTFEINLNRTEQLSHLLPKECFLVSESGILQPEDAALVSRFGADAILVGESCVRSNQPKDHILSLRRAGQKAKPR